MKMNFRVQDAVHMNMQLTGTTVPDAIHGNGVSTISCMTKAAYDALPEYSSDTLYIVRQTDGSIRLYLGSMALWEDPTLVHGEGVETIAAITQADYDALVTKDATTVYVVK